MKKLLAAVLAVLPLALLDARRCASFLCRRI
jgi:hypothetical protein